MEIFEEARPYYLKLGMTYEQYWDGPVSEHKAYRKMEKLRLKDSNTILWLQGMYFYEALIDVAPAIKAFCKTTARKYREEPYDLDAADRERREERERRIRYERIKEKVALFANAHNKKNQTPEGKEEEIKDG